MDIPFVFHGDWFGALVTATCSGNEKTKLVKTFAKSALDRAVSSKIVILLREV
jgi:hypothetical protein